MNNLAKKIIFLISFLLSVGMIFSQSNKPYAKNIKISLKNDSILINWKNPENQNIKAIYLYSDSKIIVSQNQLTKANLIAILDNKTENFSVTDKNQFSQFYAVIYQMEDDSLFDILVISENTSPFDSNLKEQIDSVLSDIEDSSQYSEQNFTDGLEEGKLRKTPLPILGLVEKDITEKSISVEAKSIKIDVKPYIFEEDSSETAVGISYELHKITEFLTHEDFETCKKELQNLLQNNHDQETTCRIYFYLGECYYFLKDYKNALNCFLLSEKKYPEISKKWQQFVISSFSF